VRFPAVVWSHEPVLLSRAWALRDNITTYDALYVAPAEQLGASWSPQIGGPPPQCSASPRARSCSRQLRDDGL
jgi:hypothetical protein